MDLRIGLLLLLGCTAGKDGAQRCDDPPAERAVPEGYGDSCEVDADCPDGFVCREGAAGGYYALYELTCTPQCARDEDCPVVQDRFCGWGPYCTMVGCGDLGYCVEDTCA
ncbi:MAG: hypothetical protein R3F59_27795 [Myxococcota bacterium]